LGFQILPDLHLNNLQIKFNPNYVQIFSLYLTDNTVCVYYKDKPVNAIRGSNCWLLYTVQINKLCGQNVEFLVLNQKAKHFLKGYQISISFSSSMHRFII